MDSITAAELINGFNYIKREANVSEAIAPDTHRNIIACADECMEIIVQAMKGE